MCLAWCLPPRACAQEMRRHEPDWLDWASALERQKQEPRPWLIDIYTSWCVYCVKMDTTTFRDPEVLEWLGRHYYAVKLDAEQRGSLPFRDSLFHFVPSRRNGFHELAFYLLEGKLAYPSMVYLDNDLQKVGISAGFRSRDALLHELRYLMEGLPAGRTWAEWQAQAPGQEKPE